jgi:DNA topoisomerase VI subunit A
VIIIIITKIYLWMSFSAAEVKYVKEDAKLPHRPFLQNVYKDIDEENEKDRDW